MLKVFLLLIHTLDFSHLFAIFLYDIWRTLTENYPIPGLPLFEHFYHKSKAFRIA